MYLPKALIYQLSSSNYKATVFCFWVTNTADFRRIQELLNESRVFTHCKLFYQVQMIIWLEEHWCSCTLVFVEFPVWCESRIVLKWLFYSWSGCWIFRWTRQWGKWYLAVPIDCIELCFHWSQQHTALWSTSRLHPQQRVIQWLMDMWQSEPVGCYKKTTKYKLSC